MHFRPFLVKDGNTFAAQNTGQDVTCCDKVLVLCGILAIAEKQCQLIQIVQHKTTARDPS